jgi:hypothetical protein
MNNRKQQTDTPTPRDAPSSAFASAEEMSPPPEFQRNQRKGRGKRATPRDAWSLALASASAEEMSHPPELQGTQRQERERRELRANDEEEDASSYASSIGAALVILLVVGVIVAVTIPLTTNRIKDSPSIDSAVTPTQSPAPTKAPTAAATACTRLDCPLAEILLQNEVADAEALQDESSPQFRALRWLANENTTVLDLDSTSTVILLERYILAVLYFATGGGVWFDQLNFLSASSVCEWNDGQIQGSSFSRGALCNDDDLLVDLNLRKSTHEEVSVLISKFPH